MKQERSTHTCASADRDVQKIPPHFAPLACALACLCVNKINGMLPRLRAGGTIDLIFQVKKTYLPPPFYYDSTVVGGYHHFISSSLDQQAIHHGRNITSNQEEPNQ